MNCDVVCLLFEWLSISDGFHLAQTCKFFYSCWKSRLKKRCSVKRCLKSWKMHMRLGDPQQNLQSGEIQLCKDHLKECVYSHTYKGWGQYGELTSCNLPNQLGTEFDDDMDHFFQLYIFHAPNCLFASEADLNDKVKGPILQKQDRDLEEAQYNYTDRMIEEFDATPKKSKEQ